LARLQACKSVDIVGRGEFVGVSNRVPCCVVDGANSVADDANCKVADEADDGADSRVGDSRSSLTE